MDSWSIKTQFVYPPPVHVAIGEEIPTLAIVRVKPLPDTAWETVSVSMTVHHHLTKVVTVSKPAIGGLAIDDEPDALFFVFDKITCPKEAGDYGVNFEVFVDKYRDKDNNVIEQPPARALWGIQLPKVENGYLGGLLRAGAIEVREKKTFGDGAPRQDWLICADYRSLLSLSPVDYHSKVEKILALWPKPEPSSEDRPCPLCPAPPAPSLNPAEL